MKFIIYLSLLLGFHANGFQLQGDQPSILDNWAKKTTDSHKMASINAAFAFRFYKHIAADVADRNVFFSPVGLSTAFAMLALGAESETKSHIYKGLGFNLSEFEESEIQKGFQHLLHNRPYIKPNETIWTEAEVKIGNALFIEESLKVLPKFSEDIKKRYDAEVLYCNFDNSTAALKQMNDYVHNKTDGEIARVVEGLEPKTTLVFLNFITFTAEWKLAFDTASIREEDFFVNESKTVKVNLMHQESYYKFLHDEVLSCWVVEIPFRGDGIAETYKGDSIVALFILPDEGKLKHLEGALTEEKCTTDVLFKNISSLHLYIPKFSISASYDVKDVFQGMGMTDAFNDRADLSGITGEHNLKAPKVIHHAVLHLRESGTETSVVTTVWSKKTFPPVSPPPTLKFNRTFLMVIVELETNNFVFMAKVVDPTEG
uniref:Serpin domain-containing protein n=1 Tax=Varanus komodoensis TaxID=61221 RepID=A0A8D2J4J2_VARKO